MSVNILEQQTFSYFKTKILFSVWGPVSDWHSLVLHELIYLFIIKWYTEYNTN